MAYIVQAALAFMTAIATFFSAPLLLDKKKPPDKESAISETECSD